MQAHSSWGPALAAGAAGALVGCVGAFGYLVPVGNNRQTMSLPEVLPFGIAGGGLVLLGGVLAGLALARGVAPRLGASRGEVAVWAASGGWVSLALGMPLLAGAGCACGLGSGLSVPLGLALLVPAGLLLDNAESTAVSADGVVLVRRGRVWVRTTRVAPSELSAMRVEPRTYKGRRLHALLLRRTVGSELTLGWFERAEDAEEARVRCGGHP